MHGLRVTLVPVAVAVLGACLMAAVMAQDEDADLSQPHGVSGTIFFDNMFLSGSVSEDGLSGRDAGWGLKSRLDDPRLSGQMWMLINTDYLLPRPPSHLYSGTVRIENADGAWVGTGVGYFDPDAMPRWNWSFQLSGEEGYEGFSALLLMTGNSDKRDVVGFAFPGSLPQYPDPVELPAD
jgi:hypothetical protein